MKTVFLLLVLAVSALAQDRPPVFKEMLDHQLSEGRRNIADIQKLIPIRDKAFVDLGEALANHSAPSIVREVFDRAWDAENSMKPLALSCELGAKLILDIARDASEYDDHIGSDEYERARALATQMQELAQAGAPRPEQTALHAKVFAYSIKESDRVTTDFKKAVNNRQKATDELAKKIGGDNVKTEVYADRMRDSHFAVVEQAKSEGDIRRILWHAEYEFEDRQITEKQYDQAQRVTQKLKTLDEQRWPSKEQLAVYRQVRGDRGVIELIMK